MNDNTLPSIPAPNELATKVFLKLDINIIQDLTNAGSADYGIVYNNTLDMVNITIIRK